MTMKIFKFTVFVLLLAITACSEDSSPGTVEESGNLEAVTVTVSASTGGKVISVLITEGSKVSKEDTIMIIDPETLIFQLRQSEASLSIAQAQYNLMRKGARHEDISQAEQVLKQSEANLIPARTDKERAENLLSTGSITKKQVDDITARYEVILAQYNQAKANFEKIMNVFRPEELIQAEANVKKAGAAIDLIKKSLRECYVLAPRDGIISDIYLKEGESAAPLLSLFKLTDLSNIEIDVFVSNDKLPFIKTGQKADIYIDAMPEKAFPGVVRKISPEAEFTPKNIQTKEERSRLVYAVTISAENPDNLLKSGMPADVKIFTSQK